MTLSANLRRQRLRNLLAKLENDQSLLKAYLARIDPAMAESLLVDPKALESVLSERDARKAAQPEGPKSPLYQAPLLCPAHLPRTAFQGWFSLGHQRVEENLLGVPRSQGGMDGYASVDYVLLEVQVCPVCFYASPYRQDFGKPGDPTGKAPEVLAALSSPEARAERLRLSGGRAGAFGNPMRDAETATAAFALALASAITARKAGESASAYKEAHIRLRLARLDEDAGRRPSARSHYAAALEAYLAYRSVELPVDLLARTSRQMVALAVMLGQDSLAAQQRSFLFESRTKAGRRLDEHAREVEAARRVDPATIPERLAKAGEESEHALAVYGRFFTQADEIWQDREQHRFRD